MQENSVWFRFDSARAAQRHVSSLIKEKNIAPDLYGIICNEDGKYGLVPRSKQHHYGLPKVERPKLRKGARVVYLVATHITGKILKVGEDVSEVKWEHPKYKHTEYVSNDYLGIDGSPRDDAPVGEAPERKPIERKPAITIERAGRAPRGSGGKGVLLLELAQRPEGVTVGEMKEQGLRDPQTQLRDTAKARGLTCRVERDRDAPDQTRYFVETRE